MSTRFNFRFLCRVLKNRHTEKVHSIFFFFTKKVRAVIYAEEIQSSADSKMTKMIKLLTFDILFPPLRDILAKTCCRMMTATTFSRQNDAISLACTS